MTLRNLVEATFLDVLSENTHQWYSVKGWKDGSARNATLDNLVGDRYKHAMNLDINDPDSKRPDHHIGIHESNKKAIAFMDLKAKKLNEETMNSYRAKKIDKKNGVYSEYDKDSGEHHVFGADSGFSYGSYNNAPEAKKHADKLHKELTESSLDEDFETAMFFRDDVNEELMNEESAAEYRRKKAREESHGPLMKANDWVKSGTIDKHAEHPEINDGHEHTLYAGHLTHPYTGKKQHVTLLGSGKPHEITSGYKNRDGERSKKGYGVNHQWYEDSGLGHRFPSSTLTVTGHIHRKADGSKAEVGDIDRSVKRTLMVYK